MHSVNVFPEWVELGPVGHRVDGVRPVVHRVDGARPIGGQAEAKPGRVQSR